MKIIGGRYLGGIIRATPVEPSISAASGLWTLQEQMQARAQGKWPTLQTDATVAYVTTAQDTSTQTEFTFNGVNIGTPAADRRVIVAVGFAILGSSAASDLSIAGNAASEVPGAAASEVGEDSVLTAVKLFVLQVDDGGTADIVVTMSAATAGCWIAVWQAHGLNSSTATDTGTSNASPLTTPIDVAAGGIAVAAVSSYDGAGLPTHAWSNLTEDLDALYAGSSAKSAASAMFAAAQSGLTIACTLSGTGSESMAVAAFR